MPMTLCKPCEICECWWRRETVGKEPGFLLSLGVDEDDADDIVQAMRDERMLMVP